MSWSRLAETDAGRDALALVLFAARCRSRRAAKRTLRDLGVGSGRAAELDELMSCVAALPAETRADIEARVLALARAHAATEAAGLRRRDEAECEWIVGIDCETGHEVLVYIGVDCAFRARIFAGRAEASAAGPGELAPLDLGEWLGDVVWLDEPPPQHERVRLYERAREALRRHDALLKVDRL